jgi:hypothetical protein
MAKKISEDLLWNQIVARAWCDEGVMTRLLSNPRSVLAEHNLEVPDGIQVMVLEGNEVKVVANTEKVRHFVLPFSPPDDLIDEDLIGGAVAWCGCAASRCGASAACARCAASAACGRCGACGCRCW